MNKGALALLVLALGILMLPLQWIFAMILAAVWHELCHYWVIRLCGGRIEGFGAGFPGARMRVFGLTQMQELICALAGPVGGLLLLLFVRWMPRLALCGSAQSLFNLLPVFPLDGGRALRCMLEILFPGKADGVCQAVSACALGLLGGLGLYGCFALRLGLMPLFLASAVIMRAVQAKDPCKPGVYSVQ